MSETKLLPCPFCGSKAEETPAFIHCSSNTCPQGLWVKADNIAAWNTRALTPEQAAAGELYAALKACHLQMLQSNNSSEYAEEANQMAIAALAKAGRS